jgi:hypothetical protein
MVRSTGSSPAFSRNTIFLYGATLRFVVSRQVKQKTLFCKKNIAHSGSKKNLFDNLNFRLSAAICYDDGGPLLKWKRHNH